MNISINCKFLNDCHACLLFSFKFTNLTSITCQNWRIWSRFSTSNSRYNRDWMTTFRIFISSKRNRMFMWRIDENFLQIVRNAIMTEWCHFRFRFRLYDFEYLTANLMQTRWKSFAILSWLNNVKHFREFHWICIHINSIVYQMIDSNRYIVNLYYLRIYFNRRRNAFKV